MAIINIYVDLVALYHCKDCNNNAYENFINSQAEGSFTSLVRKVKEYLRNKRDDQLFVYELWDKNVEVKNIKNQVKLIINSVLRGIHFEHSYLNDELEDEMGCEKVNCNNHKIYCILCHTARGQSIYLGAMSGCKIKCNNERGEIIFQDGIKQIDDCDYKSNECCFCLLFN